MTRESQNERGNIKMRETEIRQEDKRSIETRKKLNKDEKKMIK